MESRSGHYMKSGMLDSQLETLESPEGEDGVLVVDATKEASEISATVVEELTRN